MADIRITDLPELVVAPDNLDVIEIVTDTTGSSTSNKVSMSNLKLNMNNLDGDYIIDAQNFPDMLAGKGSGYHFDGVDDYIDCGDGLDISTGDYSIISSIAPILGGVIVSKYAPGFQFTINGSGYLYAFIYTTSTLLSQVGATLIALNNISIVSWVLDRSGNSILYLSGTEDAIEVVSSF